MMVGLRQRDQTAFPLQSSILLLIPSGLMLTGVSGLGAAFLVLMSGLSTFLFLRRFGLNLAAALASGILWQTNTVLAPILMVQSVALPLLFLAVEALWDLSFHQRRLTKHAGWMALGAICIAALASHGTMADRVVYMALALAWTSYRSAALLGPQTTTFWKDIVTAALLGALLCTTPMPPHALALAGFDVPWSQYVVPIVLVPMVLASAGLFLARAAPVKILLASMIAAVIAVRSGVIALPAMFGDVTLQADASWMFCVVVLTALFVDGVRTQPRQRIQRAFAMGTASVALCLVLASMADWPALA